ncbi:MAG: ATP-dependent DNA helicase RecG, partial [Chloroflexi bacterium]|nr:ATP-dependent DNA helicase RecG [Chloroflexota bacterium]
MTADFPRLRLTLERELEAGARDLTEPDGLDALLRAQARDEAPGSPLLRMIAALPPTGYGSLAPGERAAWLRRALATVRRELALEDELQPATLPVRGEATPPARKPPAKRRAPRVATEQEMRDAGEAPRARPASKASGAGSASARKVAPGAAGLDLPIERAGTGMRGTSIEKLHRLGIRTVGDALRHYPFRHLDFASTIPIAALRPGVDATVRGRIDVSRIVPMGRGGRLKATEVWISDGMARLKATWFNQPFMARALPVGAEVALLGKVSVFRGQLGFQSPEYERLDRAGTVTLRLVPVYHLTEGLPQRTLRGLIEKLLEEYGDRIEDPLPAAIRQRLGLLGLQEATRQCHYPDSEAQLREAQRRLAFDELLAIQIGVQTRKREWQQSGDAPAVTDHAVAEGFLGTLPFALTGAQRRVLSEVREDIALTRPMSRLLEGDVGSGKTVVALAAMLSFVAAGYQAVLMAPTEVLAEQHYRTLCKVLSGESEPPLNGLVNVPGMPLPVKVVMLSGSTLAKQRREAVAAIKHGGAHLVVGTHALIQEGVDYHRLGLAVVDEQHRFGVIQRGQLRRKGIESSAATEAGTSVTPHLLAMSATPIPRSLALTLYGDLDLSVIDEMPPGRTPIATRYLTPIQRREAFHHVRQEVVAGRQAFVICPLVEGSDAVQSRAATEEVERLRTEEFPDLADRILLLHGRMAAKEKDRVMKAFAAHEADILVSTAVVEVGIDVPNATVMVIEGADRFGLAQLHQFRGRVGRGEHPSTCFLLADDPTPEAEERLSVLERTNDGFALAEADLQLRGPGDLF